jgi:hypothetical protein
MKDVRADISYQLGATPEFIEVPRDHRDVIAALPKETSPHIPSVIAVT